ncbi:MAG TPA: 6-hydroxymethylpterin diphosphokinase MptE-like protein [Polyangiaceae bacterium]
MSLAPEQRQSYFFDDNVSRARLSDATRSLVEEATSSAKVVELDGGTPALLHGGKVLGADFDSESLFGVVQRAGNQPTFVVFGLGMGHTIRGLRAFSSAPLVVFEPDPGIIRSYFESGPSDLNDVPIVCTVHDLTQIWPRLSNGKQSVTLVKTPGYSERFPEQATDLHEAVGELVQRSGVNDATHRLRARVWIQDVLANLELLREHPSFLALAGQYRGVPAFIVGAGPSLGKNGRQLADAAKKGIVIALNSSARALDSYGVEPQVLACMESIDVSHLFAKVSYVDRVVRAISLTGHPNTLRTGAGPLLPVFEGIAQQNGPLSELLGFPGLSVSGSVSTLAFSLALRLGCSPIVFVGQDLAYTGGEAYAAGSAYQESRVRLAADGQHLEHDWCDTLKQTHNQGENKMIEREPLREVTAWGGQGQVMSTIGFSAVRAWLEASSVVLSRELPETRLINATEGGARIEGFEECVLSELLATLPERNISAASIRSDAERIRGALSNQQLSSWCRAQAALARTVRHAARRIRRLGETASAALDQNQHSKVKKCFEKLDIAELALKESVSRMPFVDAWSHAEIDRVIEVSGSAQTLKDDRDRARRSVALEMAIGGVIEQAAGEIADALDTLSLKFQTATKPTETP